jgi:imidazolonepropionase-like amidohydrolase
MNRIPTPPTPCPESRSTPVRLHAGWLVDGSGGPPLKEVLLTIADGVLSAVDVLPPGQRVPDGCLDYGGCTVTPGLIDSHVHLTMTATCDEDARNRHRQAPFDVVGRTIRENLDDHLRHGVVAVRDGGGCRGNAARWAGEHRGHPVGVRSAGRAWHRPGRYGRLIGRGVPDGVALAEAIASDPEPCDHVKIVNSGLNSLTEYGRRTAPQFGLEEMRAAVRAAAARGRDVMVHANGEEPVRVAVMAGCRSIEHGFFMGEENLERMAERGTVWVPTVVTMQAYAAQPAAAGRDPDAARRTLDHQIVQLAAARRLGVTVALGTDAGTPGVEHGAAVMREMRLVVQAGFTFAEAVRCASVNGTLLAGGGNGALAVVARPATFALHAGSPDEIALREAGVRAVYLDGIAVLQG